MILIEEIVINSSIIKFYDGIDFNLIKSHPKDGTKGFLIFFIDNWSREVKSLERESKINSILSGGKSKKLDPSNINNSFISIYQTDGNTEMMIKLVKEKISREILVPDSWIGLTKIN